MVPERDAPGRIVVTGASGLVGGRLVPTLARDGYAIVCLTRSPRRTAGRLPAGASAAEWNGVEPPRGALVRAAGVIHLAGEPVFGGRLTARRRERIYRSRIDSTRAFVEAFASLPEGERPSCFVCASAVGYYGSRGEQLLDEGEPPGEGFLAEVCRDWEASARGAAAHGVRSVSLRIGIVLAREGGALPLLARLFRLGLGGPLGDGRQWVPWIHLDDLVGLIRRVLRDERAQGPINAVAPVPVRNVGLARAVATELRRPALLRAPAFAIRAVLGDDLAGELLGSRRVVPERALELGMSYAHREIHSALHDSL